MTQAFPTSISLPEPKRALLIHHLNRILASAVDLAQQAKQAHWNMKGAQFFARHQLFDQLAAHTRSAADDVAERAATLGGYAHGTVRLAAAHSALPEYDLRALEGRQHIKTLVARYAGFTKQLRSTIADTNEAGDPATTDLLTQILRTSEVDLWFLESHLLS
jgi:starvation-inducible DNA-binding protein